MESRAELIPGPDHLITIEATGDRVVVRASGRVVADGTAALTLREAGYPPVQYIPIRDLDETLPQSSSTTSYCPYKGDASYYSLSLGDGSTNLSRVRFAMYVAEQIRPAAWPCRWRRTSRSDP